MQTVYFIHCNKSYFKLNSEYHDHFTRASNHIHLDTHRTAKYINSIAQQAINLYSKLPAAMKNLESKKFKSYADDIILISDNKEKLQRCMIEWGEELGRKGMEINVKKSNVMCISKEVARKYPLNTKMKN